MDEIKNNEHLFSFSGKELNTPWAEIILPLSIPKTYTYTVPQHLLLKAKIGCRAEVVFGKNKKYAGIIKSISNKKPAYETKEILNVIDDEPIIYPQRLSMRFYRLPFLLNSLIILNP